MPSGKRNGELLEERFIAEQAVVAFDFGGEAAAGQNLHVLGGRPGQATRSRVVHQGVGQRMVRSLLGGSGQAQQIVFRAAGERMNRRPARVGPRSGFRSCPARWRPDGPGRSSASPPLKRTPSCAPRPTATVSAAGTARPMAQGQAMTSTATVLARASWSECAAMSQTTKVMAARASTMGTKMELARSASRSMGAREDCACLDHARDLRQHRGFAQRFSPADHSAVVVERTGQHAAAGLARRAAWVRR